MIFGLVLFVSASILFVIGLVNSCEGLLFTGYMALMPLVILGLISLCDDVEPKRQFCTEAYEAGHKDLLNGYCKEYKIKTEPNVKLELKGN
jgi:hypothetical protein